MKILMGLGDYKKVVAHFFGMRKNQVPFYNIAAETFRRFVVTSLLIANGSYRMDVVLRKVFESVSLMGV